MLYRLLALLLMLIPLAGCPGGDDDDSAANDDDSADDDDSVDDDDSAATDDDDDSSSVADDDDSAQPDDDDDSSDDDDSAAACTIDDLEFHAEVRAGGVPGTQFTAAQSLTLVGLVSNDCSTNPVTITAISTCLVNGWSLERKNDGQLLSEGFACGDAFTDFVVPAGGRIEDPYEWGMLGAGGWIVEPNFDVQGITASGVLIEVLAP